MSDRIKFFTADYRGKDVYIGKKKFPIGSFSVQLLNQFYVDDLGLRICSMAVENFLITDAFEKGYIDEQIFVNAGDEILYVLKFLPKLSPFELLDIKSETKLVQSTFTAENAKRIKEFLKHRADFAFLDDGAVSLNVTPRSYIKDEFEEDVKLFKRATNLLQFYGSLRQGLTVAHDALINFIKGLGTLEHYAESDLLDLAHKCFKKEQFNVTTEYVSIPKSKNSETMVVAKRLHFRNYYGFILTDFFEGLRYNHYPRRCEVCKNYYLMKSARQQKYCDGYAPEELTDGEKLSCRQYAAWVGKKELAEGNPIKEIYNKRCSCIRAEKSKGKITVEFAKIATKLAKDYMYMAESDNVYFQEKYKKDMERNNLYAAVKERMDI